MAEETRIVKLEIDQSEALKNLEQTEAAIVSLRQEQKELNESLRDGVISQQEYAASKVQLDQRIKSETDNRKRLTDVMNTESNSLAAQKLRLKELIAERDKIDRSTVEGAKKFDEMNKSINQLNGSIKKAEEQGGSFQRNVGNYRNTIDQFTGGAYSAAEGLAKMTMQALRFIATPIGAVIAAIAIAIGSLVAYFKGSEEGQDRLNKIMAVGKAIFESFMNVVEDLGEVIFDTFEAAAGIVNKFARFLGIVPIQIQGQIDAAVDAGKRMADLQSKLDKQERQSLVDNAKKRLEVSELRRKADESEGQNKLDFLNAALALEKEIIDQEVADAELRLEIAEQNMRINGDDKENLKAVAEAQAAVFAAKQRQFEETRKLNKERIATEKEIAHQNQKDTEDEIKLMAEINKADADRFRAQQERRKKEMEEEAEALQKKKEHAAEVMAGTKDVLATQVQAAKDAQAAVHAQILKEREEREQLNADIIAATMATGDVIADINAKITATRNHESAIQIQNVKLQQQAELAALQEKLDRGEISEEEFKIAKAELEKQAAKDLDEIKRKAFEANKKNRIADSIIDTIQSGIAAFRALVGIPVVGPVLAAAAAAAALAYGYKNVDLIRQEQYVPGGFSVGGYTGPGGVHDPAGIVHKGEVVWNQRDVAAVGGPMIANRMRPTYNGYAEGGIVTGLMTSAMDQQVANQMPVINYVLDLTEFHEKDNALQQKVQIVEAA